MYKVKCKNPSPNFNNIPNSFLFCTYAHTFDLFGGLIHQNEIKLNIRICPLYHTIYHGKLSISFFLLLDSILFYAII